MSERHALTAGIDLGDRYTHVCLLDSENGEVIEESRIPTNTKAFQRRFSGIAPMRIAIETGTHSPWVSRLLEECGHEVLVANARKVRLIYGEGHKNDKIDAEKLAPLARVDPKLLSPIKHRGESSQAHTWRSFARAMRWWVPEPSSSITFGEPSSRLGEGFPNARQKPFTKRSPSTCQGNSHQPWSRSWRP
jgi:hypothetical protein